MDLPDHRVPVAVQVLIVSAVPETLRVGASQIQHHTSLAVDAHCPGVGVHRLLCSQGGGNGVGIVGAGTAGSREPPDAPVALLHVQHREGLSPVALLKEVQLYLRRGGGPELELCFVALDEGAQVVPLVGVFLDECRAVKNARGHGVDLAVALDLHGIGLGHVQFLLDGDDAADNAIVQAGEIFDLQLPPLLPNMDLAETLDPGGGAQAIADLVGRKDARHGEGADGP